MSLNLGVITTQPCNNMAPAPDTRCSDPIFARLNPTICPAQPTLVIKPEVAITCALGSVQFKAYQVTEGVEVEVTTQCVFTSSDPNTAVVGVDSGSASGLAVGDVTIGATFQGMNAHADLTVLDCSHGRCQNTHVALMVLVDASLSMSLTFDSNYPTRLDYAKAAAERFISEIDGTKDSIGLMSFTDATQTLLSPPSGNVAAVAALVDGITQTQDKTSFFGVVNQAISTLNATTADRKVILIISDGEDTAATDDTTNDPFTLLTNFKAQGGIVMCLGVRSSNVDQGFYTLSQFSSGGFFVNGYPDTEAAALDYLSGLKGYICAGNCTPAGDFILNRGQLNYTGFQNWNVSGGNVDLLGNGFLDLLPGNGLYVDLGGSSPPYNGTLTSKTPFNLIAGHVYRVTLWLAGNQQNDPNDLVCQLQVLSGMAPLLSQSISVSGSSQGFQPYAFNFTAPANMPATISIQQQLASGFPSVPDPRWGLLLNEVSFVDTTNIVTLLDDNFDTENPVYVPPSCGAGTTYVYLSSLGHYGYAYGYNCYGGYGCLNGPPGVQLPDPNPLPEIEIGTSSGGGQTFTSTQTKCASCISGSGNVGPNLVPVMTGYTTPSGVASASSEFPGGNNQSPGLAWEAFQGPIQPNVSTVGWISNLGDLTGWLSYQFAQPTVVEAYVITAGGSYPLGGDEIDAPRDWTFEGSLDGATWTVLDTQKFQIFQPVDRRPFGFVNSTAYSFYRINVTANNGDIQRIAILRLEMYASVQTACATATETGPTQTDAFNNAVNAALAAAQAMLNCSAIYSSTQQATATCPTGTCGVPVTMSATATSYTSQFNADHDAAHSALLAAQAALNCNTCNNTQAITVADAPNGGVGLANLWPSCACVSGQTGTITKVTVTLSNWYHTFPSDIHALLRAPDGTAIYLFGHCGDGFSIGTCGNGQPIGSPFCSGGIIGPTITFDDAAAAALPSAAVITTGTYKPGLYGPQAAFPPPSPISLAMPQTLATFNGKQPNGTWTLWLIDANPNNTGGFSGGWSINVTSA